MARWALLAVLAAACASGGCGRAGGAGASTSSQQAQVGRPAPNWSETSLPGPTLSLGSLRGKAVYLNFFATWCPPCNQEAPAIDTLARKYRARGLQVVGVDVLENARKAAGFRTVHRLSYPVVVDDGTLRDQYEVNGLPVHVFIDRSGTVRKIVVGELSPDAIISIVQPMLR